MSIQYLLGTRVGSATTRKYYLAPTNFVLFFTIWCIGFGAWTQHILFFQDQILSNKGTF